MDTQLLDLLKILGTDAIKILGPATIASFATYKAAKSQFQMKVIEIEKGNELEARKTIFEWLKNRREKLEEEHSKLAEALGQTLGFAAGVQLEHEPDMDAAIGVYADWVAFHSRVTPKEIDVTLSDIDSNELNIESEKEKLLELKTQIEQLVPRQTYQELKQDVFTLLETYGIMLLCNQLVLDKLMKELFSQYVQS